MSTLCLSDFLKPLMRSTILGFAAGILLLQQQPQLWSPTSLVILLCLSILIFVAQTGVQKIVMKSAARFLGGAMIGWIWASGFALFNLSQQLTTEVAEQDISVIGVVTSLPSQVEFGQRFQFAIERVLTADVNPKHVPKKVMLSSYSTTLASTMQPGERWQFTVRLRKPHGLSNPHGSDYEAWMLERGLGATGSVKKNAANQRLDEFVYSINNCIEFARSKLRDRIVAALPNQPYAPVLVALVIGDQNGILQSEWKVFARTGVSHLFAISGLHVTLIAGLFASLMYHLWRHSFFLPLELPSRMPSRQAAALSGVFIALVYVALAGFGVPAQRTLIMISTTALLTSFGRMTSGTNVLCFALGLVLLVDPWAVLSPGFWLSFSAVAILFYASLGRTKRDSYVDPNWEKLIFRKARLTRKQKVLLHLREASITQYAITLGLVPLTMLLFNQVSLVSPIANSIAIPLVSLIVTPGALLGSILPAPIGDWLLMAVHFLLYLLHFFLAWLSEFSWAVWQSPRPEIPMFVCALLGTLWCLAPSGWPLRWAGLLAWLPLCLNISAYPRANELTVTALDVGQGMALLIETEKHRLLYDTGPAYSAQSDAGSGVIYPYLRMRGITSLDGLMISHSDKDHSGGAISLMQMLPVDWVSSSLSADSVVVQEAMQRSQHTVCLAGQTWEWDGVQFEVLHPAAVIYTSEKWKPNAKSCTLKITNGQHSILLAGDIESVQEKALVATSADKLPSTVLLAPHHGSGTSSTLEFLRTVNPEIAIFQLGYHNRYRHPKSTVWQRYGDLGIRRLRSDEVGAIMLSFSDTIEVDAYRETHKRYWYTN